MTLFLVVTSYLSPQSDASETPLANLENMGRANGDFLFGIRYFFAIYFNCTLPYHPQGFGSTAGQTRFF